MKASTWGPYGASLLAHLCLLGFSWPVLKPEPVVVMPIDAELLVLKRPVMPKAEAAKPATAKPQAEVAPKAPKKQARPQAQPGHSQAKSKPAKAPSLPEAKAKSGPLTVKQKIQDVSYKARLRRIIKAKWKAPQMQRDYQLAFYCQIQADGRVGSLVLKESSGFDLLDQAAKKAILTSAPFPAPPQGLLNPQGVYEAWFRFHPEESP